MADKTINLTLKVWRQKNPDSQGRFEIYEAKDISVNMSFLEMLDVVNEGLIKDGKDPIAFDHDCREGICGTCGAMINGRAHGPKKETTLCQFFPLTRVSFVTENDYNFPFCLTFKTTNVISSSCALPLLHLSPASFKCAIISSGDRSAASLNISLTRG